jgi:hypothetical protein
LIILEKFFSIIEIIDGEVTYLLNKVMKNDWKILCKS